MNDDNGGEFGFTCCAVLDRNKFYVGGVAIELEEADVHHAILFHRQNADAWEHFSFGHRLAGIACYVVDGEATLLTVGIDGVAEATTAEGADEDEQIGDGDPDGQPGIRRPLHAVRVIGQHVYVAGARRQVFRRLLSDGSDWQRVDQGLLVPTTSKALGSLLDIHGIDENWIVAVGLRGEIWQLSNNVWSKLVSPTDNILEVVRDLGDGELIAAGALGTIVHGSRDSLQVLKQNLTTETFTGAESAFGGIYLCTDQGNLFRLDGGVLSTVEAIPPNGGGGAISYADGLLLLVTNEAVMSFDGERWQPHFPASR